MKKTIFMAILFTFFPGSLFAENPSKCFLGWNTTESGNYSLAIKLFDECIQEGKLTDKTLARTYRNIGITYERAGSLRKAIAAYSKAIEMNPEDVVEDYIARGNSYDKLNMFKKAMSDYDSALKIKPGYAPVFYERGVAYERQRMWDKAKDEFIKAYTHGLRTDLLYERFLVHGLKFPEE